VLAQVVEVFLSRSGWRYVASRGREGIDLWTLLSFQSQCFQLAPLNEVLGVPAGVVVLRTSPRPFTFDRDHQISQQGAFMTASPRLLRLLLSKRLLHLAPLPYPFGLLMS
jgi:hypothetical protein